MYKTIQRYRIPLILFTLAAIIYFVPPLFEAKDIIPWRTDPIAAMADARTANKAALLYFTATWCDACEHLKHTTFADRNVASALSKYVTIKIDIDQFNDIAHQYPSDGLPHFVILDGDGKIVRDFSGALEPKDFLDWLNGKAM